jgi:hypothetical protein
LRPTIKDIGRLSIARRASGCEAAIAAARRGAATNRPMTGNGRGIASQPAALAAAASPIHRPSRPARTSLARRDISAKRSRATTMNTIKATVAIVPAKSSI